MSLSSFRTMAMGLASMPQGGAQTEKCALKVTQQLSLTSLLTMCFSLMLQQWTSSGDFLR
jgi:hypothetical protein